MENEKKKKKNKKKKNKQIRTSEDETVVSESTSVDDNHIRNGQNDHNPISDKAILEEASEHVRKENLLLAHNKTKLEDTIKHLHEENNLHIRKGADLELKIAELAGEKLSWLQKEAEFVEKIRKLQEEKTALDLEGARFLQTIEHLEKDKTSLILKENSSRETIVDKNNDISRLQAQVLELEEHGRDLLQENKQLMENIADYQSKILNLERRISSTHHSSDQVTKEVLSSQVDAARLLVDKLITENAELIGKVNELFVELQRVSKAEVFSGSGMVGEQQMVGASDTASSFDDPESPLIQRLETLEPVPIHKHSIASNTVQLQPDNESLALIPTSSRPVEAGEIVQIPLHENEDRDRDHDQDREREVSVEEEDVLLSDAPLIGAPYRLISFMAKYVSGADLVAKS